MGLTGFNPTMVRLRRQGIRNSGCVLQVSIPLWCDCDNVLGHIASWGICCFNPTMVRLRRDTSLLSPSHPHPFQSHYGAIATINHLLLMCWELIRFNPTMVRLRLTLAKKAACRTPPFQSHYGAIATASRNKRFVLQEEFQSHYGAIATPALRPGLQVLPPVSIPLWCDCDNFAKIESNLKFKVSIPLWCDCDFFSDVLKRCRNVRFHPTMVRLRHKKGLLRELTISRFPSHYGAIATP